MDWTRAVDAYCERTGQGYWDEPVNALTNLAFLLAAAVMWRRCAGLAKGRLLAAVLFAIGLGSWLFHTHATAWAGLADTLPILGFILLYFYAANRDFLGWPRWAAAGLALAFVPAAAVLAPLFGRLPFFATSAAYWPVALLILGFAALLPGPRETRRGLALGGALLCLSLTARSLDQALCPAWPLGTHFLWHILNALMLGWMIEVWRRHVTGRAQRLAGR
jgi:hypothetical protein